MWDYVEKGFILSILSDLANIGLNRPKIGTQKSQKLHEGGLPATWLTFEKVSATKNMRDYVQKGFILDLLSDLAYRGLNRPKLGLK